MMLGVYLLTAFGLNLKSYYHVIEADDGPFKGSTAPMSYMGMYEFKILNTGKITPEELFTNAYIKKGHESEHLCIPTKRLRVILDAKYEKSDLH